MSQDEFTRLFLYIEKRFDKLEAKLSKKADAEPVYAALDALTKRLENVEHELAIHGYHLSRHETRLKEIAVNTHTQLSPV